MTGRFCRFKQLNSGKIHRQNNNQGGFTLIEMIIALSIFVLTVLIATNIYLIINNVQRRTLAMQKVQDDVRYLFEAMAQEVRLGRINYDYYLDNSIDLHPLAAADNEVLAVVNQLSESVFFRINSAGDKVQYCKIEQDSNCRLTFDEDWQDITPEGVRVIDLEFIITPSADPFIEPSLPDNCSIDNDCSLGLGYRCETTDCKYYTDGGNFQPKVRMVLKTESEDTKIPEQSRSINMQTIISSRITQGQVKNTNY